MNGWDEGIAALNIIDYTASIAALAEKTDLPANFADLSISATTGLVMVAGGTGGGGGSTDLTPVLTAIAALPDDLTPVLTAIANIPTTDLERADGPLVGLVADVSQIKKVGDTILHTRIASVQGVSNTVIETRV